MASLYRLQRYLLHRLLLQRPRAQLQEPLPEDHVEAMAERLQESLTFHNLRRGFCTRLAEAGKSAHVIKVAACHTVLSTSMRYVHLSNRHLKRELEDAFD